MSVPDDYGTGGAEPFDTGVFFGIYFGIGFMQ